VKSVPTKPYAVGLAVAAIIAVAGCTGDPKPTGTSSSAPPGTSTSATSESTTSSGTSTTPNTSASTSAAADPNFPAAARAKTGDGAVVFTTYFATQANTSYRTLKPELLEPLVLPECKTCAAMIKQVNDYITKKQKYEAEFITPTTVAISSTSDDQAQVFLSTDSKGGSVVDSNGNVVEKLPAQRGSVTFYLGYRAGSWRVAEIKSNA